LIKFNNQYLGKFVGDNIEIGKSRSEENLIGLDAITGATVTVIAQNQVMMTSGSEVAKQVGILKPVIRPAGKIYRPPPRRTLVGCNWLKTAACSASP
jgi:NosR/NirI family nitrous oxide reductase transcriptional regulator